MQESKLIKKEQTECNTECSKNNILIIATTIINFITLIVILLIK